MGDFPRRGAGFSAAGIRQGDAGARFALYNGLSTSGTACAAQLDTVISVLRKLIAAVAVAALLGPATAALCASGLPGGCAMPASIHACCDGPRISSCECHDADGPRRESEPAQPFARVKADTTSTAALSDGAAALAIQPARVAWLAASPPPAAMRERLSLLSTLLV